VNQTTTGTQFWSLLETVPNPEQFRPPMPGA
jgi:hypothetical protein